MQELEQRVTESDQRAETAEKQVQSLLLLMIVACRVLCDGLRHTSSRRIRTVDNVSVYNLSDSPAAATITSRNRSQQGSIIHLKGRRHRVSLSSPSCVRVLTV